MTPKSALIELLARVGAAQDAALYVTEEELSDWPEATVAAMKSQRLITKARPATSAICPGCEHQCVMPVHTPPTTEGSTGSFIVCDKRSDINRVAVPASRLGQWRTTCDMIAGLLSQLLGLGDQEAEATAGKQWNIGVLKGRKYRSRVTLFAGDHLTLLLAGHTLPLTEVLGIEKNLINLDKDALIRLVDNPADKTATESPEQRRERLRLRVRDERAKGTTAFLQKVAKEEGVCVSRIKQLIAETSSPAAMWPVFAPSKPTGASSKRSKRQR